jgi:chromosome segregation ATPase
MEKLNAEYEARQKEVDETTAHVQTANKEIEVYRVKIAEIKRGMNHQENKVKDLRKRRDTVMTRIKKLRDYIQEVQEKAMRDTQYHHHPPYFILFYLFLFDF